MRAASSGIEKLDWRYLREQSPRSGGEPSKRSAQVSGRAGVNRRSHALQPWVKKRREPADLLSGLENRPILSLRLGEGETNEGVNRAARRAAAFGSN